MGVCLTAKPSEATQYPVVDPQALELMTDQPASQLPVFVYGALSK